MRLNGEPADGTTLFLDAIAALPPAPMANIIVAQRRPEGGASLVAGVAHAAGGQVKWVGGFYMPELTAIALRDTLLALFPTPGMQN